MDHRERQITGDRRDGQLGSGQAKQLQQQERAVRQRERSDLAANDGRLTNIEHRQLSGELSAIESEIRRLGQRARAPRRTPAPSGDGEASFRRSLVER